MTVAILGVGLIGGSIGLALRRGGRAVRVVGIGRDPAGLELARGRGAIDHGTTDPARGLAEADVVVVCTPVGRIATDAISAAAAAPPGVLITDAGSTKASIVRAVEADDRARGAFVAGHPLAGSERKGVAHARADLFDDRPCVLTPTDRTPSDRIDRARSFWQSLGCRVVTMTPDEHDRALAMTSHLPHAVAAALARSVPAELLGLAAGAYRDGTRVSASTSELWAEIFLDNRGPLLDALSRFEAELTGLRRAVESADPAAVASWWDEAAGRRSRLDGDGPTRENPR